MLIGSGASGCACEVGEAARLPGCAAATFEVTPSSALVSIHASGRARASVRVIDGGPPIEVEAELRADRDHTAVVELAGLEPDREISYTVAVDDGEFGPYWLRTAPRPDRDAPFRFLFTADIMTGQGCSIFEAMAGAGASFWLSLGDFPYSDSGEPACTLPEYRAKHRVARLARGAQTLFSALPAYAIYDDHEVFNNWDGAARQREPDRVAAGLAAWDEWFPVRATGDARYRSWRWGRLAEFFLLDCRRFRADNAAPDGEGKSMLGDAQREWLIDGLRASSATFKFVATSVPLAFGTTGNDSWRGFQWERDRILGAVTGEPIANTVFLTCDQHWFASHHLPGGIVEFQAGPAAAFLREPAGAHPEEVFRHVGENFAEVTVEGGPTPRLTVRALGPDGDEIYRESVAAASPSRQTRSGARRATGPG